MRVDMARSNGIRKKLAIAMKSETASSEVQNQIAEIISEGFKRAQAASYEQIDFGGDGGLFLLADPAQAHKVAVEILRRADEFSTEARNANIELGMRCFRIGIDIGPLTLDKAGEYNGQALTDATRLEGGGPTGEIRMSESAYCKLPEDIRKLYGDREMIPGKGTDLQGIPGRRFDAARAAIWLELDEKSGKPYPSVKRPNKDFETHPRPKPEPCFVICPFRDSDGRIDSVFKDLIKPACEQLGMLAERADQFPGDRKQLIREKLKSAAIVIAYLGKSGQSLNSNVILEVGYRLATGRPLVIVCDATENGDTPDYQAMLPIQLNSDNVITAGADPKEKIGSLCAEMNSVKGRKHSEEWDTPYPIIMYRFTNPTADVVVEESNSAARQLFGEDSVRIGCGIEKMREVLSDRIDAAQRDARKAEFNKIFPMLMSFSIFQNPEGRREIPMSRIPLVFKDSPADLGTRKPIGYLPVITRWSYEAGVCRVRYMYLPVSNAMRMDPNLGCYVCDL
jgi:hypothetical protein